MPKNKPSTNKLKIKLDPLYIIIGLLVIAISALAYFQLQFNQTIKQQVDWLSARQFGDLIKDSMDRLNDLKTELPNDGKIAEMKLQLPAPNLDEMGKVLYRYSEGDGGDIAASLEITNQNLIDMGFNKLNGLTHEEIMNGHSEASACSRGFTITRSPRPNSDPTETKTLADGRTMYLYRDGQCGQGGGKGNDESGYTDADMRHTAMDELQDYLMQAQSY